MTERRIEAATGFDEFVEDRGGALWWAAWLLTGDAHHAEDLVQTALTKTYGHYASFENDRHFESYVRTTIYRTFVSWWRRRAWRSQLPARSTRMPGRAACTAIGTVTSRRTALPPGVPGSALPCVAERIR